MTNNNKNGSKLMWAVIVLLGSLLAITFNYQLNVINRLSAKVNGYGTEVDEYKTTITNMSGDIRETRKDVEYMREDIDKIMRFLMPNWEMFNE